MKATLKYSMITVIVFAMTIPAIAQTMGMHGKRQGFKGDILRGVIKQLNLTEEQEAKITALRKEHMLAQFDHRQAMRKIHEKQRDLRQAGSTDKAAAYKLIDNSAKIQSDWQKQTVEYHEAIKAVLTPEQVKQLNTLREARKENRGMRGNTEGMTNRGGRGMQKGMHNRQPGMRSGMDGMHRGMHSGIQGMHSRMNRGPGMQRQGKGQGMHERIFSQLNLTDEQKDAMAALQREKLAASFDHREAMKELREEKRELLQAEKVDKVSVYSVIDKITNLQSEWKKAGVDHMLKMREILTDEQIQKLEQLRQKRGERRGRNFPPEEQE